MFQPTRLHHNLVTHRSKSPAGSSRQEMPTQPQSDRQASRHRTDPGRLPEQTAGRSPSLWSPCATGRLKGTQVMTGL